MNARLKEKSVSSSSSSSSSSLQLTAFPREINDAAVQRFSPHDQQLVLYEPRLGNFNQRQFTFLNQFILFFVHKKLVSVLYEFPPISRISLLQKQFASQFSALPKNQKLWFLYTVVKEKIFAENIAHYLNIDLSSVQRLAGQKLKEINPIRAIQGMASVLSGVRNLSFTITEYEEQFTWNGKIFYVLKPELNQEYIRKHPYDILHKGDKIYFTPDIGELFTNLPPETQLAVIRLKMTGKNHKKALKDDPNNAWGVKVLRQLRTKEDANNFLAILKDNVKLQSFKSLFPEIKYSNNLLSFINKVTNNKNFLSLSNIGSTEKNLLILYLNKINSNHRLNNLAYLINNNITKKKLTIFN